MATGIKARTHLLREMRAELDALPTSTRDELGPFLAVLEDYLKSQWGEINRLTNRVELAEKGGSPRNGGGPPDVLAA